MFQDLEEERETKEGFQSFETVAYQSSQEKVLYRNLEGGNPLHRELTKVTIGQIYRSIEAIEKKVMKK